MNPFRPVLLILLSALVSCGQGDQKTAAHPKANPDELVQAKGKLPLRILAERAPNLETPLHYFLEDFTPNNVFFVRWHLANLPDQIDADTFRLRISGAVQHPLALSLTDLKTHFKPYTIAALCECAGNARSLFNPRVQGAQWRNGGMGNAQWTGVKLKDLLEAAGIDPSAVDISFSGLDSPPMPTVADFEKSLSAAHSLDGEVMVAYAMNGESLPLLNGFPLKLVVPGWYATYWVGMLSNIRVHPDKFHGFWMDKAYLSPRNVSNGNERPDSLAKELAPVNKIDVRSIFVSPEPDSILLSGKNYDLTGVAMDGGSGITKVEVSADSGRTWSLATLGNDLGKYSWRHWHYIWKAGPAGHYIFKVRATNADGETQPVHQWNRSGYMRNEIETLNLEVQ